METNVLGREVARVRKLKKITQEQLGRAVGLSKSSIGKMENGRMKLTWEDASILLEAMGEKLLLLSTLESESEKGKEQRQQMLLSSIEWFAAEKGISLSRAYKFLAMYKGLDFLSQNYRYEQTLPKSVILDDIVTVCERNGGRI